VLLLHWKPSQHGWWKPIIGVLIAGLYKIRCLWRVNMQPTPSSRTSVLNPLLPSTSTVDALLHLICCTHLCFWQKKESPPFFLAQERICVCFVQDELALFVIILNFHAICQNSLCFVINGQSEWTQPLGWIVWVDRKHSFMGSFSLASHNGQLSFLFSYLPTLDEGTGSRNQ